MDAVKYEEIKERVSSHILDSVFSENDQISDSSLLFKEGFFDSMGFITLISFIEEQFNIQIEDRDLVEEKFESINAISDFIEEKLKSSADNAKM